MPVSAKQKVEDPGEIQASPPLNGNRIRETVGAFRQHHDKCLRRRANGVSYEIKVETIRTEGLRRKYLDNLRQQQAISGRIETPSSSRSHLSSSSDCGDSTGIMVSVLSRHIKGVHSSTLLLLLYRDYSATCICSPAFARPYLVLSV